MQPLPVEYSYLDTNEGWTKPAVGIIWSLTNTGDVWLQDALGVLTFIKHADVSTRLKLKSLAALAQGPASGQGRIVQPFRHS